MAMISPAVETPDVARAIPHDAALLSWILGALQP
jgi:hypothetical protein